MAGKTLTIREPTAIAKIQGPQMRSARPRFWKTKAYARLALGRPD